MNSCRFCNFKYTRKDNHQNKLKPTPMQGHKKDFDFDFNFVNQKKNDNIKNFKFVNVQQ